MGRFQNLRPDGRWRAITRRDVNASRYRADVAINEERHISEAVLGELQQGSLARRVAARTHFALVAGKASRVKVWGPLSEARTWRGRISGAVEVANRSHNSRMAI